MRLWWTNVFAALKKGNYNNHERSLWFAAYCRMPEPAFYRHYRINYYHCVQNAGFSIWAERDNHIVGFFTPQHKAELLSVVLLFSKEIFLLKNNRV